MKSNLDLKNFSLESNWGELYRPQAHINRKARYGRSETKHANFEGSPDLTLSPYASVLATLFDATTSDDAPDKDRSPAMEIVGLHKTFSEKVTVNHIDLSVPCGSFFGLVGPDPGSRPSLGSRYRNGSFVR
jgi:hypothetical protein